MSYRLLIYPARPWRSWRRRRPAASPRARPRSSTASRPAPRPGSASLTSPPARQ